MYMYIQCVGNEIARDCVVQGVGGGGGGKGVCHIRQAAWAC